MVEVVIWDIASWQEGIPIKSDADLYQRRWKGKTLALPSFVAGRASRATLAFSFVSDNTTLL
jgi:hypothetical protein